MKVEWFTAKGANFSAIQHTLKVSKNGRQKIISFDLGGAHDTGKFASSNIRVS